MRNLKNVVTSVPTLAKTVRDTKQANKNGILHISHEVSRET